jgi:hypothetical protein
VVPVVRQQGNLANLQALVAKDQRFVRHQIGQQKDAPPEVILGDL